MSSTRRLAAPAMSALLLWPAQALAAGGHGTAHYGAATHAGGSHYRPLHAPSGAADTNSLGLVIIIGFGGVLLLLALLGTVMYVQQERSERRAPAAAR